MYIEAEQIRQSVASCGVLFRYTSIGKTNDFKALSFQVCLCIKDADEPKWALITRSMSKINIYSKMYEVS